ncbi:hypothetical protein [Serratia phage PCH45]|uniref:hypothetical protein n=1 Tax=Serratia phage PCH45 TaxID=2608368 RepID=UPI0012A99216|nr:hypothetical protein [Serratia phage PCH45]
MKRFEVSVRSNIDFITLEGSTVRLTNVGTEIIAKDQEDLNRQLNEFLTELRPFHGMSSGLSREEAVEIVARRNDIVKELTGFTNKCYNLWTASAVAFKFHRWELSFSFRGDL